MSKPRKVQSPARLRALSALAQMRHGKSLSRAARLEQTTARTVRQQLGKQVRRTKSGRYRATRADTLRRDLNILGADGYITVAVRGSRQAGLVSQHLVAVNKFLNSGDAEFLRPFVGKRIGSIHLLTDPESLREFADAGAVRLDALYRRGGGPEN